MGYRPGGVTVIPIHLNRQSDTPLYRQIATQLRGAMTSGAFEADPRLPAMRRLAQDLGVNRLTIARAYRELADAGLISGEVGRGTFVRRETAVRSPAAARRAQGMSWSPLFGRAVERVIGDGIASASFGATRPGVVSFASLFPDPALFPVEPFRRAMDGVLRRQGHRVLGYGPPGGYPPLRAMIAAQLRLKGIAVSEEEIVITSGSQQGIDLVARVLLDPGDTVLVENPTYTGAVQVFHAYGAQLSGVPVDEQGVIVPLLAEAVRRRRPKLIYLMPNFQNPTSETMTLARRQELIRVAAEGGLPILEDDFGGDLRFEGVDLPTLKALDASGSVIYVSTFAKKLLPGLRIGWVAAPREVAEQIVHLKKITDFSTSLILQAALHEFCLKGDLERHLDGVVGRYRERRDAMLAAMKRCFPREAGWTRPAGGLVIWVTLPNGVDAVEVAARAEERGVLVGRGDLFHVDGPTRQNLRLTFSQADIGAINRGIRILGDIIKEQIRTRREEPVTSGAESLPII